MFIPVFVILLFQLLCSIFVLSGIKLSYGKIWMHVISLCDKTTYILVGGTVASWLVCLTLE